MVLVVHVGGGWFFSSQLIEDGFLPNPDVIEISTGFDIEEVTYSSPLGEMDAWLIPAAGTTWVIHVHGKGATPAEAEHLFAPLQNAGYPQLSITYRNDEDQPLDPSGYYQYGVTEWEDVAGALDYAAANGATAVVLSGFSTGSAHILSYVYKHDLDQVVGLIFDSPNLDMGNTVDFAASMREMPVLPMNVPPTVTAVAKFITSLRIGVNWRSVNYLDKAGSSLRIPVLIHHGTEDDSVPDTQSIMVANTSPDIVTLNLVPGADHVGSYEANPGEYISEILIFLRQFR